jgi:hypothetical protein
VGKECFQSRSGSAYNTEMKFDCCPDQQGWSNPGLVVCFKVYKVSVNDPNDTDCACAKSFRSVYVSSAGNHVLLQVTKREDGYNARFLCSLHSQVPNKNERYCGYHEILYRTDNPSGNQFRTFIDAVKCVSS